MKKIKTQSVEETIKLGEKLGSLIKEDYAVILLNGNLAAGKTTFTKGVAKGLGIDSIIKSPTFTIMRQYTNRENKSLYHLDLYRLSELGNDFDLEEYVDDFDSVIVIEWPYQVEDLLPEEYLEININIDDNNRIFELKAKGKYYEEVIEKI